MGMKEDSRGIRVGPRKDIGSKEFQKRGGGVLEGRKRKETDVTTARFPGKVQETKTHASCGLVG